MTLQDLIGRVQAYNPAADVSTLQRAYDFSAAVHKGQKRMSGEPYLTHPLEVAGIISRAEARRAERRDRAPARHRRGHAGDARRRSRRSFGTEIADLVDGVTKIGQINFTTREEKQAENFRKMLLAMARDIRVILVKLADRTHNMRTLGAPAARASRTTIAQETLDIYAPLAHRLGIYWIKSELEDNALRFLHPEVYYQLKRSVAKKKAEREKYIEEVHRGARRRSSSEAGHRGRGDRPAEALLLDLPEDAGAEPALRPDLRPDRVPRARRHACASATRRSASCTRTGSRCPAASRTTSRCPKANMYQSLHTTVIGPYGERIEVQIRTDEMHRVAEYGHRRALEVQGPGRHRPPTTRSASRGCAS